jgi:hypothetical protein
LLATVAHQPAPTVPTTTTDALARAAIAELVAFWAELPVDPIGPVQARAELLRALPCLRRLAEAVGA